MPKELTPEMISLAVERLRALADETRVRIMMSLRGAGEMGVNDLAANLGLNQPSTSKHLSVLKQAGIVGSRKSGTQVFYFIKDDTVFEVCDLVCTGVRRHHQELSRSAGISNGCLL